MYRPMWEKGGNKIFLSLNQASQQAHQNWRQLELRRGNSCFAGSTEIPVRPSDYSPVSLTQEKDVETGYFLVIKKGILHWMKYENAANIRQAYPYRISNFLRHALQGHSFHVHRPLPNNKVL